MPMVVTFHFQKYRAVLSATRTPYRHRDTVPFRFGPM
jgi:hypothetical protein